jgi:membrane protein YdbS with pleckstrin-like domain
MSEPSLGVAVPDTRLHPIYLIIDTAKTLRQAIPLLVVTIFSGAPWWVNAALFALVMAIAIAQWHVRKYSVVGGLLLVRSGVVNQSVRVVPITRITALAASQSLTQRLVGVWGLHVQSPGDRHGSAVTLACLSGRRLDELRAALESGDRATVPADPEQFKLGLIARYEGFLGFFARFETLQVSITGFDISRAMDNSGSLVVSLNFRHAQIASPISDQRIKAFEARLRSIALRDPFDPANGNIRMVADANADDLTWTYHLTSISQIGKTKYATIDGRDYNVGDELRGLVVSAIGNDNVTLMGRDNGKERQRFLKFRNARRDRI